MSRALLNIAGITAAMMAGRGDRERQASDRAAWRARMGMKPEEEQKAPIDRLTDWVGSKASSMLKPAEAAASTPPSPAAVQDAPTVESTRQTIDQPAVDDLAESTRQQSEAASNSQFESDKDIPAGGAFTTDQWDKAPDMYPSSQMLDEQQ
jgi:hypothetical protein